MNIRKSNPSRIGEKAVHTSFPRSQLGANVSAPSDHVERSAIELVLKTLN